MRAKNSRITATARMTVQSSHPLVDPRELVLNKTLPAFFVKFDPTVEDAQLVEYLQGRWPHQTQKGDPQ
jgi:hypothetical protein